MKLQKQNFILLVFFLGFIFSACSTKKNTALTRTYHNITSRYNIFFNGNESFKKGEKKIYKEIKDDYSQLLPVFPFSPEAASAASGDMDRTTKKSTKVIALHSITAKPEIKHGMVREEDKKFYNKKEFNKWIDDSYFLIGKCHFNKGDYALAIQTFRFILNEYPDENVLMETRIWLARALVQSGDLKEAFEILKAIREPQMPVRLKAFYYAVYADAFIHEKKYKEAIPFLEKAVKYEKIISVLKGNEANNKVGFNIKINSIKSFNSLPHEKMQIRYTFILAQLYELTNQHQKSYEAYSRVIKMSSVYEITFNALINRAGVFEEGKDDKIIRSQLVKMLNEPKNKEYRDQIYFAIGNIDFKQKRKEDAIENYKKSAATSLSNDKQKARSFLVLADIYYDDKNYLDASRYYDSTVALIDKETPGYGKLRTKAKVLNKLAKSINNVFLEDSVQVLAKMSESERNRVIDALIEKVRKEEEEKKKLELEEMLNQQSNMELAQNMGNSGFGNSDPSGSSKWYFYNPTTISRGETEFKMRWGSRKLEDNWRRSNRSSLSGDVEETEEVVDEVVNENKKKKLSNKTREYYLVNIPLTDSMLQASHEKIKNSLYTAGEIYKEDLNEPKMAVAQYEQIIKRYPNDPMAVEACFILYNLYRKTNNTIMSERYRDMILSQFPESNFAKVITNPDFIKELEAKEKEVSNYYELTYQNYVNGNYSEAVTRCDNAIAKWQKHEITPKFYLLKAMSIGKMRNVALMRATLDIVVSKFPKSAEADRANAIITYMDTEHPEIQEKSQEIAIAEKEEKEIYTDSLPGSTHYVGIFLPKEANMNQVTFNLVNFNLDNFTHVTLDVKGEELNKKYNVIWVRSFKNYSEAKAYFEILTTKQEDVFKDSKSISRMMFIISDSNQKTLMKDGSENKWMRYFKQHYK